MKYVNKLFISLLFSMLTIFSLQANEVHKVVIQVSTDDVRTQNIALNNAVNLQKLYGVEIVNAGVARIIELQEQNYSYIRP